MFASRGLVTTPTGHRCTSAAKFTSTRDLNHDRGQQRSHEIEDERHPLRSLACALISSLFCPILGFIALFYAIRALRIYSQGFYAEASISYKKAIRWSLITFITGLTIGSIVSFSFFVKAILFM
ncbi:unnamed protein product [Rotaria sordida]|uniref:Uncharacterized protein n=1 Tax=Rotaria sordida TaxID=392033 RepID=A0A814DDY3_9BILA|nr:unnamed protein product [Rotaria sordida]CAF0918266.1 unnamed protein product [Rotaria sordida]CAF0952390.1 unnamed protein product [Rotaria sordida]CAF0955892.1 unnamed protein product [Rotaria sordida]